MVCHAELQAELHVKTLLGPLDQLNRRALNGVLQGLHDQKTVVRESGILNMVWNGV